jgi:hypothetical protein
MTGMKDDDIDRLLAAAASRPAAPSEGLMERVLADSLALQPQSAPFLSAPRPLARISLLSRLAASIGGGPALAGLFSAAMVGIAIGYLSPTTLDFLTGTSAETVELFPETDFLQTEG